LGTSVYINTDLIFGLFTLLGFRFAPRLRDLSDQTLYRARRGADYGVLAPAFKKDIRDRLIVEQWDDLNRVAASLKDGLLRPSLLVSRLQSMQRQNPLQQALQEVGRIAKTWHISVTWNTAHQQEKTGMFFSFFHWRKTFVPRKRSRVKAA
jgi:TnpA family transposase